MSRRFGFDDDTQQIVVSAQSVEKVVPEVTNLAPFDWEIRDNQITSRTGENFLTVDYSKLVPLLIESIKELDAKLEKLQGS